MLHHVLPDSPPEMGITTVDGALRVNISQCFSDVGLKVTVEKTGRRNASFSEFKEQKLVALIFFVRKEEEATGNSLAKTL